MSKPQFSPLLHPYFRRQAAATPAGIAIRNHGAAISYEGLVHATSAFGGALRDAGIGGGQYIGLHLDRSIDSVVATLAIHEAGAAVVPLPPSYPEERRREILD